MDHCTPSSGPGMPQSLVWPGSGWDPWRKDVHTVHRCWEFGPSSERVAPLSPATHFTDGQPEAEAELGAEPEACVPLTTTAGWAHVGGTATWTHYYPARHMRPLLLHHSHRSGTCSPPSLGGEGVSDPAQFNFSLLRAREPEPEGLGTDVPPG